MQFACVAAKRCGREDHDTPHYETAGKSGISEEQVKRITEMNMARLHALSYEALIS